MDLPYADSCLEYGLELITRALTEEGFDTPRSSASSRQSEFYDDETINAHHSTGGASAQSSRRGSGESSVRSNPGSGPRYTPTRQATNSSDREEWRRGTIFLDDEALQILPTERGEKRSSYTYATSTNHSSDDGRQDHGPLTPPESSADHSDDEEAWLGKDRRVPEWAAPDIVDYYKNGWSDDHDQKFGATSGADLGREGIENLYGTGDHSWQRDEEGEHSPSALHLPSSGRSVLPGGRWALERLPEGEPTTALPPLPSRRSRTTDGDSGWLDGGSGWYGDYQQSRSASHLPSERSEDANKPRQGPQVRNMRSLLLTKPIAPRPATSERRESGGLRDFSRSPSNTSLSALRTESASSSFAGIGSSSRLFGPRYPATNTLPTPPISPLPGRPHSLKPASHSTSSLNPNRRYHYQKSQAGSGRQSWEGEEDEDSLPTVRIPTERSSQMLKKGKPSPMLLRKTSGDGDPGWYSAGPVVSSFPSIPPPPSRPLPSPNPQISDPPSLTQDAPVDTKSVDTKSVDTKSVKEKKSKGKRVGTFVGKVFASNSKPQRQRDPGVRLQAMAMAFA
ncbi:hypothetical protein DFP72DRAFT_412540 [Ephemerocybe angulata]|uniref:Uncharacterized protein n=1 Tax=Ephemerocybe angulata TaxID=980116 RepID=A0A8H6IHT7_9AGAR|nr:hypothetical protein DFP72DRAFT_412540 [Tulosesus angulatus]